MIVTMTYQLAHAAATDAGNASMRKNGRTAWSKEDYNVMVEEFNRLWPMPRDGTEERTTMTHYLYIAQMIDYGAFKPFRIIEKVSTVDGARDRITMESFATLEEAQAFVKEHQ